MEAHDVRKQFFVSLSFFFESRQLGCLALGARRTASERRIVRPQWSSAGEAGTVYAWRGVFERTSGNYGDEKSENLSAVEDSDSGLHVTAVRRTG